MQNEAPDYVGSELRFDIDAINLAELGAAYDLGSIFDHPLKANGAAIFSVDGIRTRGPVEIRSQDIDATIDGLIALTPELKGSEITFMLGGANLATFIDELISVDNIPTQPFDFGGRLQIREDDYRFREVTGNVGRDRMHSPAKSP